MQTFDWFLLYVIPGMLIGGIVFYTESGWSEYQKRMGEKNNRFALFLIISVLWLPIVIFSIIKYIGEKMNGT